MKITQTIINLFQKTILFVTLFASVFSTSANIVFEIASNKSLTIKQGDITQERTQAIVNAANPQLLAGAGVCGAIFKAAGANALQDACDAHPIVEDLDVRCPFGDVRITKSFKLEKQGIQIIIHAAGPDCRIIKNEQEQDRLLESTYKNILNSAEAYGIKSVSIPFISSAIYSFDKDRASSIALKMVIEYLKNKPNSCVHDIRFVLFSRLDYDLFKEKAENILKH